MVAINQPEQESAQSAGANMYVWVEKTGMQLSFAGLNGYALGSGKMPFLFL